VNWLILFALFWFAAAFLMVLAGVFLPGANRSSNKVAPRDQTMIYAAVFVLTGFAFLYVGSTNFS
jgi:hypothetical protein